MQREGFHVSDKEVSVQLISAKQAWVKNEDDQIVLHLAYGERQLHVVIPNPNTPYEGEIWHPEGDEPDYVGLNLVFFGPHYT
jgi:hypothetical protein